MKKIMNALVMVLLLVSTLAFSASAFVDSASQTASNTLIHKEIETRVHAIVDEIQEIIPVENDQAVDDLILKIQEDEKVSEIIDTYSKQFIHDLASEEAHTIDMNDEVHGLLLGFSNEFSEVMGDVINPIYKEAIIKEIITRVDFNEYYELGLTKFKDTMSPSQMSLVRASNTLFENNGLYRNLSLVGSIVSALILLALNFSDGFGLKQIGTSLALSGLIHIGIRFGMPQIITSKAPQLKDVFDFAIFLTHGLILIVVGSVLRVVASFQSR